MDKSLISKDSVVISQVALVSVLPYSREIPVTSLCCVYRVLNTGWQEYPHWHTHIHVCMASVSSVESNAGVNLAIDGGWNPSSAALPPWWELMEGILYSVYLECCVKLPGVMVLPVLCHSHMGHLGFANIAHLHLGKDEFYTFYVLVV